VSLVLDVELARLGPENDPAAMCAFSRRAPSLERPRRRPPTRSGSRSRYRALRGAVRFRPAFGLNIDLEFLSWTDTPDWGWPQRYFAREPNQCGRFGRHPPFRTLGSSSRSSRIASRVVPLRSGLRAPAQAPTTERLIHAARFERLFPAKAVLTCAAPRRAGLGISLCPGNSPRYARGASGSRRMRPARDQGSAGVILNGPKGDVPRAAR